MAAIHVDNSARLTWGATSVRCALGRSGIVNDKREGDGGTPTGVLPLRRVFYRADRIVAPQTALPLDTLERDDGWCDDPADDAYNQHVKLPYAASCEALWREDRVYDVIVVLGHNDDPIVRGAGSAIFLHVARADYGPTEGCIALGLADLEHLLRSIDIETSISVVNA